MTDHTGEPSPRPPRQDDVQRFTFPVLAARGQFVTLTDAWHKATQAQALPPYAKRAVGEAMATAALLADSIKFEGRVALQARGDGSINTLLGECSGRETLRGFARLRADHEDDETTAPAITPLVEGLGGGQLAISLIPERGDLHQGIVELQVNLGAAIEHYFQNSEQLPTRVRIAADDNRICAVLLQQLPSNDPGEAAQWERLDALFQTCSDAELLNLQREVLLKRLFATDTIALHTPRSLRFACTCSRERSEAALKLLGADELAELRDEPGGLEVTCDMCGARYQWDAIEAHMIFEKERPQIH